MMIDVPIFLVNRFIYFFGNFYDVAMLIAASAALGDEQGMRLIREMKAIIGPTMKAI